MKRFVFSGDGHLREPKDLFTEGLPASLRQFGIHTRRDEKYVMTYAGERLVHRFPLNREVTTDENDKANLGRPNAKGAVDIDARMADMDMEGIDAEIAERWGELNARRTFPVIDGLLAATALVHGLIVVTRNTRDVEGTGARVLDPFLG